MDNIIGGHEAEMAALAKLESSAEARSIRLRFAARDLIADCDNDASATLDFV